MKITSILIIFLLACTLIVSGCTETESLDESPVLQEYNRHLEIIKNDIAEMEAANDDFDLLFSMADADGDYNSDELIPLIDSIREMLSITQRMNLHSENFMAFIDENEDELKELGIDTFEDKNALGELNLELESSAKEFEQLLVEYEDSR
jgi:hypothetical protein